MKRFAMVILAGLALGGTAQAQNRFVNPGFEDGSAGWINFGAPTGSVSTQQFHSGKSSAQLTHERNTGSGWVQAVTGLELGALYRAEAYAYRNNDTVSAAVWLHSNSPPFYRSSSGKKAQKTGAWELLTAEMAPRLNGEIWVHVGSDGTGNVWFDDVSLTLVKTRNQRTTELSAVTTSDTATVEEKVQAYLDLGEVLGTDDLTAALASYNEVLRLAPKDKTKCRNALSDMACFCRRHKEYAKVTLAIRNIVDNYSSQDTVEGATDLARLAEALGEEAYHLLPDYAAAVTKLNEALDLFSQARSIYRKLDAAAHKDAIDVLEDRLVVTRYDIQEYTDLGRVKADSGGGKKGKRDRRAAGQVHLNGLEDSK